MQAAEKNSANRSKFHDFITFTEEAMQRQHVPGVALGLLLDGEEYTAGLGVTSIENPLPVTSETLFQIGSITKTYTTTALLRLVEQGKLSLDDRVRKFIPNFTVKDEFASENATVRHLLDHTAGWVGDYFTKTGAGDDNLLKYVASLRDLEQVTPLGAIFTYNNTSFNIAGRVIEIITGKTYEAALQELVLDPLEMHNTFFFAGDVMVHRFVAGHVWKEEEGRNLIARPWGMERCENPCGGLISNVRDQLRYARFHMGEGLAHGGERLLSAESLALMQTPIVRGDMAWMGLNWFIWDIGGVHFFDHDGSTNGQQAALWFTPQKGLAFTALTNQEQGYLLLAELTRWVRREYLGVVEEEPVPIFLPDDRLLEYAASYRSIVGDVLEMRPSGGGLLMTHTPSYHPELGEVPPDAIPPLHSAYVGDDRFVFTDQPFKGWKFDFVRDDGGKIAWLRFSGRVFARQQDD
jgi:CubicO group peptidase (beta-lactamase class C family)